MKVRRRAVIAGLASVPVLVTIGCSKKSASGGGGTGAQKSTTTVSMWLQNSASATKIQQYFADWGPKNDLDVKVSVQASDQYPQAIVLALKTGKAPDVFPATKTPQLVKAGELLALDGLLDAETKKAYADVLTTSSFHIGGKTYGVPTTANTIRLAYNKDVFTAAGLDPSKPPTTLSEVQQACEAIAAKVKGVYGFGLPLKWAAFANWMALPIVTDTSKDLTVQGLYNNSTQQFEMSKAASVVSMYRTMIQKKWAYPGASSLANDAMRSAFAQGKIGMFVSAAWDISLINDKFKTKANWAATALPVPDGQSSVQQVMNVGTAFSINAKTKVSDAAVEVVEALASKELIEKLSQDGAIIPVRSDVKMGGDLEAQYAQYAPTSHDVQYHPSPANLVKIQGDTYPQTVVKLILGKDDISSGLAAVDAKYNKALGQAVSAGTLDLTNYQ